MERSFLPDVCLNETLSIVEAIACSLLFGMVLQYFLVKQKQLTALITDQSVAVFSGGFLTKRFHCNPALLRKKVRENIRRVVTTEFLIQVRHIRRTPSPLKDLSFKHPIHTIAHDAYFQESSRLSVSFLNKEHNYCIKTLAKHVYRSPCIFIILYCALEKAFLKRTKGAAD